MRLPRPTAAALLVRASSKLQTLSALVIDKTGVVAVLSSSMIVIICHDHHQHRSSRQTPRATVRRSRSKTLPLLLEENHHMVVSCQIYGLMHYVALYSELRSSSSNATYVRTMMHENKCVSYQIIAVMMLAHDEMWDYRVGKLSGAWYCSGSGGDRSPSSCS